jgi:hypothetical protein
LRAPWRRQSQAPKFTPHRTIGTKVQAHNQAKLIKVIKGQAIGLKAFMAPLETPVAPLGTLARILATRTRAAMVNCCMRPANTS